MGEDEILELNIPTGVPLVYEFDVRRKLLRFTLVRDSRCFRCDLVRVTQVVMFDWLKEKARSLPRFFICA
jgi:hypothetical protein